MAFDFLNLRSGDEGLSSDDQFAQAALEGLSRKPKRLPSWMIFDNRGSEIFTEITQLPSIIQLNVSLRYFGLTNR